MTTTAHAVEALDPALEPLADLARTVLAARRAGGESPAAHRAIEDALADLRAAWTAREADGRTELAGQVRALAALRPGAAADGAHGDAAAGADGEGLPAALARLGVRRLRPGQDRAVAAALGGRDALVIMATGSGKSLCYQAPSAVTGGLTVVISPLIALMADQVGGLRRAGIAAHALHSGLEEHERREVLESVRRREVALLYVAPERFNSAGFRRVLAEVGVDLLVVDEAHCVSEWGHEFRPDYRRVGAFRAEVAPRATMALTATAAARVRRDIVARIGLRDPLEIVGGFDRPNIVFDAAWVGGSGSVARRRRALHAIVGGAGGGKAIIYCGTRRAADETAADLRAAGHAAVSYHAGRSDRTEAQEAFRSGEARVVAATNAFGMGVDVPDVRLVVHITLPDSLEQLYQEAGRAGRDGEPARHVILAGPADEAGARRRIARARIGVAEIEALLGRLAARADAEGRFALDRRECDDDVDVRLALAERVGVLALTGAPGGGRAGVLRRAALDAGLREALEGEVRTEVARRRRSLDAAAAYVREDSCRRRVLLEHFDDPGEPAPEERCCDHCATPVDLAAVRAREGAAAEEREMAAAAPSAPDRLSAEERPRFDALRAWRRETAARVGWPAFRVSPNRALAAIAARDPRDRSELGAVPGVGPWLIENYGDEVLAVLERLRG